MTQISRNSRRRVRARRVRATVSGTAARPRVSVFRSLTGISAQVIDDQAGVTLAAASLSDLAAKERHNTVAGALAVGKVLAKKCEAKGVAAVVFDRAGYRYHGKVKAVADGLREGGIAL